LHPDRANENKGGESVVSYLLSLAEIRRLNWHAESRTKFLPPMASSLAEIDKDQGAICHKSNF
jgi:hypothetical protein